MIQRLNERMRRTLDRPIRVVINPAALCLDGRFAVGIDDDLKAKLRETFRKMCYKQFRSTVIRRRYGDERRRNESDLQFSSLGILPSGERCCGNPLLSDSASSAPLNE